MSAELSVGTRIRVRTGVTAPDLPEFTLDGWTGTVAELTGKKANRKYIIQWDDATVAQMPTAYREQCEQKQLYHLMACLTADDIEVHDGAADE